MLHEQFSGSAKRIPGSTRGMLDRRRWARWRQKSARSVFDLCPSETIGLNRHRSLAFYFGYICYSEFSRKRSFFSDLGFGPKRACIRTGGHPGRGGSSAWTSRPGSPRTGRRVGQTNTSTGLQIHRNARLRRRLLGLDRR